MRKCSLQYGKITNDISLVFLFIAAIIPDLDLVFFQYVTHHTITHSVTFWSLAYLPLFLRWRMKVLPYFIATLSHLVGDLLMGKPPLLYGIADTQYGFFFDYATSSLSQDWFMFTRSCLDLAAVLIFLVIHEKGRTTKRIFGSDKDVFVGLPILGILIISIFVASSIQDKLLSLRLAHDWPVFIAGYSILAASHLIVMLMFVRDARIFVRNKQSEQIAK